MSEDISDIQPCLQKLKKVVKAHYLYKKEFKGVNYQYILFLLDGLIA